LPASEKPCMGHSLSRGDFRSFVCISSLLQFYCSAPGGAILPSRPLVPSADAASTTARYIGSGRHTSHRWFATRQRARDLSCSQQNPRRARHWSVCAHRASRPCIRSILWGSHHDAVIRIGGELRGGGSTLHSGLRAMVFVGSPPPRMSSADPARDRQTVVLLSDPFPSQSSVYDAGRRTMPSDSSPVVARRQSAMSSLRANATIIVLRVWHERTLAL
jgi:hypothetical protein